jgi:DHA2 family methylenomycin A resistance protein-like MFS transporter
MDAAPADRGGAAAGLLNTARQVGSALGVAVAGSLLASRAGFLPGLHLALAVSGAAFLAGVLVTLAWVDRRRRGLTDPALVSAAGTRSALSVSRRA